MRSSWDGKSRALLRVGLALVAASMVLTLAGGVHGPVALSAAVVVVALAAALLMAIDRAPIGSSLVLLGALVVLAEWQTAQLGAPHRSSFAVGATLLGWSIGLLWGRGLGERARYDLAESGGVATLAATYVSAAASKLVESGLGWANPAHLSGTILSLHRLDDSGPGAAWATIVVGHPAVARTLVVATLVIQLGAFVYVTHPVLRMIWGTLLIGFHEQVALLTGISYGANVWLLLLFSYPWSHLAPPVPLPPTPDRAVARRVLVAALVITAAALAVAWILPIRAYTVRYD